MSTTTKIREDRKWEYVDFVFDKYNRLIIRLNDNGREFLKDETEDIDFDYITGQQDLDIWFKLIEDILCDEWENVNPNDTGDLTENPFMLSDNIIWSENGDKLLDIDCCWYWGNYAVSNIIVTLFERNELVFDYHNYKE